MDKKSVEWLYRELPKLVDEGIIPAESAERIKEYYGSGSTKTGSRTFLVIFGVIGALLVGLGIILILAHNWPQLTKLYRLSISMGFLVAAQIAAGSVLWFKKDSIPWREATATILMLMVGSAMALVGQTYHLIEDTDAFLLTWMLLSVPLVYLMNSASVAVLYSIGITVWAFSSYFDSGKQIIWVLFSLIVPYYWGLLKNHRYTNTTVVFSWVILICFYFCFGTAFARYLDHLSILIYGSLFTLTYIAAGLWFSGHHQGWPMPFKAIGLAGSVGLTFLLTFNDVWRHITIDKGTVPFAAYLLALGLVVAVVGGSLMLKKRKSQGIWQFSFIPCVMGFGYILRFFDVSGIGATVIMNGYMLWLSVSVIAVGVREQRIGVVNLGMLMIAVLIVARFFDIDLSFIVRGVAFVLVGIGFLVANVILVRRKAGWRNDK
ncbi:hypothetical protein SRRS_29080 [Sporomusa rhizae]|uniref:DUF2157 domain-containing protein n=1 Tax=Sporomusa rhizae TaxID=357999 RepID=UPI00352AD951